MFLFSDRQNIGFFILFIISFGRCTANCTIPEILQGTWFSWENKKVLTEINAETMTNRGYCVAMEDEHKVNHTLIFRQNDCFTCVKFLVRTVNVLEKIETSCQNIPPELATVDYVCRSLNLDQQLITLFSDNYVAVNCRSSLEGVWNFSYQNRFRFKGECSDPYSQIRSCQQVGSQFLITNQKFHIMYKKCEDIEGTFNGIVEYSCLGDWFVGKNHYFAVANTKESRKNEKYRCFLKNRDDDLYIGVSITAECNTLKTVEESPERLHITPVKSEVVEPGCRLPQNFSGEWINTAHTDADVFINETHIIETYYPNEGRYRRTIYVCREQRDTRIMMARLTVDGCQEDYVCFDFVPQHHHVIRYRKGVAVIVDDFHTVCSSVYFPDQVKGKYDMFLKKDPVAIRCPFAGRFNFTQKGDIPFETRIIDAFTMNPRSDLNCTQNISDFSICDEDQKIIAIDENNCLTSNYLGKPVDDPDYKMKCIGFWKENMKSYLITYDEFDLFSKYRCWVYQRADLNRILMSQAVGPFCDLQQDVYSWNFTQGAAVHLQLQEYERERDSCPMYFDDGTNPWLDTDMSTKVSGFDYLTSSINKSFYLANFSSIVFLIYCKYLLV